MKNVIDPGQCILGWSHPFLLWHLPLDWRTGKPVWDLIFSNTQFTTHAQSTAPAVNHRRADYLVSLPIYTILLKKGYKIDVMTKNVLVLCHTGSRSYARYTNIRYTQYRVAKSLPFRWTSMGPYFERIMYWSQWREKDYLSITFELCHELHIWCQKKISVVKLWSNTVCVKRSMNYISGLTEQHTSPRWPSLLSCQQNDWLPSLSPQWNTSWRMSWKAACLPSFDSLWTAWSF